MENEASKAEQARKLRNEYNRKWRAEHKEKVKQYNETYWEKRLRKIENEKETEK